MGILASFRCTPESRLPSCPLGIVGLRYANPTYALAAGLLEIGFFRVSCG